MEMHSRARITGQQELYVDDLRAVHKKDGSYGYLLKAKKRPDLDPTEKYLNAQVTTTNRGSDRQLPYQFVTRETVDKLMHKTGYNQSHQHVLDLSEKNLEQKIRDKEPLATGLDNLAFSGKVCQNKNEHNMYVLPSSIEKPQQPFDFKRAQMSYNEHQIMQDNQKFVGLSPKDLVHNLKHTPAESAGILMDTLKDADVLRQGSSRVKTNQIDGQVNTKQTGKTNLFTIDPRDLVKNSLHDPKDLLVDFANQTQIGVAKGVKNLSRVEKKEFGLDHSKSQQLSLELE